MSQSILQAFPVPISNGISPKEGPKGLPLTYDFSAEASFTTNLQFVMQQGRISCVQGFFIDNGTNDQALTIAVNDTNQKVTIPAGYQGFVPALVSTSSAFNISSSGSKTATVIYLNVSVQYGIWPVAAPTITGGVTSVSDAILDATVTNNKVQTLTTPSENTDTDHSNTIAVGGTAQIAAAANAARKGWLLQNLDAAEDLWVCTTGNAAIGVQGSFDIPPGGSIQGYGAGAISVNATTAGHKFSLITW